MWKVIWSLKKMYLGKNRGILLKFPGKNGHAWTEIYLDGLGWIPLEMTPSYYGVMEEADLKTGLEAKGQIAVSVPETEEEPRADENIRTNWSLKLALFGMEKLLVFVFDGFLSVLPGIYFDSLLYAFCGQLQAKKTVWSSR